MSESGLFHIYYIFEDRLGQGVTVYDVYLFPVQQHDAGGVHRGRPAFVPCDPVGLAARPAHAASALSAAQAGVDLAAEEGKCRLT